MRRKISWRFKARLVIVVGATGLLFDSAQGAEIPDGRLHPRGSLHGMVLDRVTRQGVPYPEVTIVGEDRSVAGDERGAFAFDDLPPGTYHLRAGAIGYDPQEASELAVAPSRVRRVEILLRPTFKREEEVDVTASATVSASPSLPTSSRSLSYEEVRRSAGAVEDVQRMLQALPGVAGASDQDNEIVVRGGSPFENLTVIDGIEVENINHFGYYDSTGGPISALNSEFLQDVTFASGGFQARYGDKLSSVLELDLREGSRNRFTGALDFNMAGVGGNLEGPLPGRRGSFLVSYHKSFVDLIAGPIGLTSIPHYWSTQGKLVYDVSSRHSLAVNALFADDYIHIQEEDEDAWSHGAEKVDAFVDKLITGARLRSLWGAGYTDLVVARVRSGNDTDVFEIEEDESRGRERLIYREDLAETTWQTSLVWNGRGVGRDEWSVGAGLKPIEIRHDRWFEPRTTVFVDGYLSPPDGKPDVMQQPEKNFQENTTSYKSSAFAQYTWRPTAWLTATGGVRYDGYAYSDRRTLAPRLSFELAPHSRWRLGLAWGEYRQALPLYLYTYGNDEENRRLPHARARQSVASLTWEPRPSTRFSAETYYKTYDNLPTSEESIVRETTGDYAFRSDRLLPEATKKAWGLELFAHQRFTGSWYGTLSYSYGDSRSEDPAYGVFPAQYDFRHVATAVIGLRTSLKRHDGYRKLRRVPGLGWLLAALPINGDDFMLSTRIRYISGRPYTLRVWCPEGAPIHEPIWEGHWEERGINNTRYPDYQRWDVRLDNKHYIGKRALVFYFEIENVLDRANVAEYFYADDGEIDTAHQFRRFFVGGMRFEF
jgi:outer membrane receptor protein involved in Fe transport